MDVHSEGETIHDADHKSRCVAEIIAIVVAFPFEVTDEMHLARGGQVHVLGDEEILTVVGRG